MPRFDGIFLHCTAAPARLNLQDKLEKQPSMAKESSSSKASNPKPSKIIEDMIENLFKALKALTARHLPFAQLPDHDFLAVARYRACSATASGPAATFQSREFAQKALIFFANLNSTHGVFLPSCPLLLVVCCALAD